MLGKTDKTRILGVFDYHHKKGITFDIKVIGYHHGMIYRSLKSKRFDTFYNDMELQEAVPGWHVSFKPTKIGLMIKEGILEFNGTPVEEDGEFFQIIQIA